MVDRAPIAVGVVFGTLLPGVFYIDGYWGPQFGFVLVVVWAVAGWLLPRNWRTLRGASNRLQVLYVLFVLGAPTFGIHADLPIGEVLWIALQALVLGAAVGAVSLGAKIARTNREENPRPATTPAD